MVGSGEGVEVGEGKAGVVVEGGVREWGAGGYGAHQRISAEERVIVLTPASSVRAIEDGFMSNLGK